MKRLQQIKFKKGKWLALMLTFLATTPLWAQSKAASGGELIFGLPKAEFLMVILITMIVIASVLVLVVAGYVISLLNIMLLREQREKGEEPEGVLTGMWKKWFQKQNFAVPIEREADIMLDHEYDGIHELDNHLPPWWKNLFYATIGFAAIYLIMTHMTGTMPLQEEEFQIEMAVAAKQVEEYKKNQANSIDENNVEFKKDDAAAITAGKAIFEKECVTCHGQKGEGGIGPNMTDQYWLYGGDIKGIFKTIKYGAKNGMQAWEKKLKPEQIKNVASYILTLQGTNPPNGKAPQGKKLEAK